LYLPHDLRFGART